MRQRLVTVTLVCAVVTGCASGATGEHSTSSPQTASPAVLSTPLATVLPTSLPAAQRVADPSATAPATPAAIIDSGPIADVLPFARPPVAFAPPPPALPATPAPSTPQPYSIDLYRSGVFASQTTTYYCVPAAIEVMMNLIDGRPFDTSRATQDDLYAQARSYLIAPYFGRAGAQPEGWADVLNADGVGHYAVGIRSNRVAAIDLAARDLSATHKPVGLLVWAGFHAWVMSGFTSIGDPANPDFTVTGIYVEDVWWPRPDTSWGPSPRPDRLMSISTFAKYFLPYEQRGEGGLPKDGRFVVIVPTH